MNSGISGGRLGITIARYTDECSRRYEELLVEYHKRYQFQVSPGGGGFRDSSELQVFLSNTGFVDIQVITEDAEFIYADEQEWWGSKWTHGPRYSLERMQLFFYDRLAESDTLTADIHSIGANIEMLYLTLPFAAEGAAVSTLL